MSYAIAPTFEGNRIGVRRLRTLSGAGLRLGLGDAAGTAQVLIANGWDSGVVNTLVALGASDQQLTDILNGVTDSVTVMAQLGGTAPPSGQPVTSAENYPQSAVPTAYGILDFTKQETWNSIASLFASTQQRLNVVARQAPNDPDVISHVQQFNNLVTQWAGYYQTAFGSAPSPMPLVTLSGLGFAPILVPLGIIAGLVVVLAILHTINTWLDSRPTTQTAQTQASLATQYNAAVQRGDTGSAQQILATMQTLANPAGGGLTDWNTWFKTYMPWIFGGFAAMVLVPPLIKKL